MYDAKKVNVLFRVLWLYGLYTLLSNVFLVISYFFLPEGLLRNTPLTWAGQVAAAPETAQGEFLTTLFFNLGIMSTIGLGLNLITISGFPHISSLSKDDREFMENNNVSAMMAWGQAMLNWAAVEPSNFHCPVLWLVGSEDQVAMTTVREYRQFLPYTKVKLHIIEGLDHTQVFDEIDRVFATMLAFSQA